MTDDEFIIRMQHLRLDKPKGHDLSICYAIAMHFYGSVEEMAKHYTEKATIRIANDARAGKRSAGLKP